jgi:hypothetical protein
VDFATGEAVGPRWDRLHRQRAPHDAIVCIVEARGRRSRGRSRDGSRVGVEVASGIEIVIKINVVHGEFV